jgi:hypothetical protein
VLRNVAIARLVMKRTRINQDVRNVLQRCILLEMVRHVPIALLDLIQTDKKDNQNVSYVLQGCILMEMVRHVPIARMVKDRRVINQDVSNVLKDRFHIKVVVRNVHLGV